MSGVVVRMLDAAGALLPPREVPRVVRSEAEWRAILSPDQFRITRDRGTEPPFCGTLLDNHRDGRYHCVCCGLPLFDAAAKFDSGTGWPSFFQPVADENILRIADRSHGMHRVEARCVRCDAHLGHVFPDGPPPTGERHCLNSEALVFVARGEIGEDQGE